jgi:alkylation response protein AidB-like acyl-CoA dehydrogenase
VQDVDASSWLLVTGNAPDGTTQVLVSAGSPGVTITELDSLDITRRFAEVRFDGVRVPAAAVIGAPGRLPAEQLAIACTLLAAETVGAMDHDFGMTLQYAKDRIAFGRPIGSFQAVKHQLADTSLALEMSKATVLAAARTVGADDDYGPEAASMAKAFVGEAGVDLAQACFQIFGGIGYTWEHDQHLYLRRITTDAGLFGDPAWHREYVCQLAGL